MLTRTSVDPDRTWVNYELDHASNLLRTIIPCLFEPEKAFMSEGLLPKRFTPTSLIAFSENPEEGLRRLLNAIGDRLPKWGQEFTNHARGIQHKFVGRQKDLEALKDLNDMGAAHRYLKEPERALDKFKESLELHLLLGNRRLESITRCNIAGTLCDLERFQEGLSEAVHAKGRVSPRKSTPPTPLVWAHCWEARGLRGLGGRGPAEERLREALTLSRGQDNPRGLAGVLGMLAIC